MGLMLIGMIFETLGIGLVIPAIALLTQANIATKYSAVRHLLEKVGNPSREDIVVGGMLLLVAFYLLKAIFIGWLTWRQMSLVFGIQAQLSQRLFTSYLNRPYTFHLQRNSAQLLHNVTSEVVAFTFNVLLPGLALLSEGLVVLGFASLMLVIEPLGALAVAVIIGSASWAFSYFTRLRVARWGEQRQLHEGLRVQHVQQGLGGVKEVKLLGREREFLEQFRFHDENSARVARLQLTLQQLPRLWLEVLAVGGLAILVLTMLALERPLEALLPTLAVFAAAAFRLMPSVNRMLGAVQSIRFGLPSITTLYSELRDFREVHPAARKRRESSGDAIDLVEITYAYPKTAKAALNDVSLSIRHGECVGIVGASGAGKSTLVDILLGLLAPSRGSVRRNGENIQLAIRDWQDQVGYVPQSIFLTDDTLARNVAFGLSNAQIDPDAVWRALRAAQLEQFARDLPDGLETIVGERGVRLSGGQRQRIGIARALYQDPAVLVLDEATSSLDTATERGVMEAVNALHGSKTVIIVAHRLSTVEHCDRLYRLEDGRVTAEGSYEQVTQLRRAPG